MLPVELMNTIWADRDGVHDALDDTPEGATGRPELRCLRDALRRLAADATDDDRPAGQSPVAAVAAAVDEVNRAAAAAPRWKVLLHDGDGWDRRVASAHDPAAAELATIAEQAIDLFGGPGRADLRACHAPGCVLYFVKEHPRREWCSAACGNRARVARHYRRTRS